MDNEFQAEESLPPGFTSIEKIRALTANNIHTAQSLTVIGIVKDQQAPMTTRGTDAKYTFEIVDTTVPPNSYGLKVNMFSAMDKMPSDVHCADVVLLRKVKAQIFNGNVSLITNYSTELHFMASSTVPKTLQTLKLAKWSSYPQAQRGLPNTEETRYAAWLHSQSGDLDLPSETEFEQRTVRSLHHKDRYSLLKDLKCDQSGHVFVNLIGEVFKVHDSGYERLTLYLTDYTSNSKFYNYVWGSNFNDPDEVQDDYGYLLAGKTKSKKSEWPGPFGRMTIQITVYDDQATYIREHIENKQWVFLNNVQIKYGNMGGLLEGYLRDKDKISTTILDPLQELTTAEPDTTKARLREGIKRKFDWKKRFEQQQKQLQNDVTDTGKRKHGGEDDSVPPKKMNSKQRRQQERALAEQKVKEADLKKAKLQNLNQNIKCQYPDREPVTLKEILRPLNIEIEGVKHQSPFANLKYRANVRVVDYFPPRIEDFAVGYRSNEFDGLSDYSGEETTDTEVHRKIWKSGKGFPKDCWEWRFSLQVEDADVEKSGLKERMWLIVDNPSAQMLFNLPDDATSLRNDPRLLSQVKEQLFKLWGDLEERKSATLPKIVALAPSRTQSSNPLPASSLPPSSPPKPAMPSTESDDENDTSQESRRIQCGQRSQDSALQEKDVTNASNISQKEEIRNKGFTCCIKQYGVKIDESDPKKANAGDGTRWQRVFGMFGTMID